MAGARHMSGYELIEDSPSVGRKLAKGYAEDFRGMPVPVKEGEEEPFEDFGFMARAEEKRQLGNEHFREGRFTEAVEVYGEALMDCASLTTDPSVKLGKSKWAEVIVLRATVALNRSTALLKLGNFRHAGEMAVECVLGPPRERKVAGDFTERQGKEYLADREEMPWKPEPKASKPLYKRLPRHLRAKGWFRIAQCNAGLGLTERTREAVAKALDDATDDMIPEITQFMLRLQRDENQEKESQKKQFSGFFNKLQEHGGYANDFMERQAEKRKRWDALSAAEKFKRVDELSESDDSDGENIEEDSVEKSLEKQKKTMEDLYRQQQISMLGPQKAPKASPPLPKAKALRPVDMYVEAKRALEVVPRRVKGPEPEKRTPAASVSKARAAGNAAAASKAPGIGKAPAAIGATASSKSSPAVRKGFMWKDKKPPEPPATAEPAVKKGFLNNKSGFGDQPTPQIKEWRTGGPSGSPPPSEPWEPKPGEDYKVLVGPGKYKWKSELPPEKPQFKDEPPSANVPGADWVWDESMMKWKLDFKKPVYKPEVKKAMDDIARLRGIKDAEKAKFKAKYGDYSSTDEDCPPGFERDHRKSPMEKMQEKMGLTDDQMMEKMTDELAAKG